MSILIADDDTSIIVALKLLLNSEGIESDACQTPDAVLQRIRERSFQLALIDLNYCKDTTSGAEGLELITSIRMALGASPGMCIRGFLKDGCRMVAYGLGIGGVLAIVMSYGVLALLGDSAYAVRAIIPTALLLGLVMGSLVMLANYFPARKIVAMEPDALRYE